MAIRALNELEVYRSQKVATLRRNGRVALVVVCLNILLAPVGLIVGALGLLIVILQFGITAGTFLQACGWLYSCVIISLLANKLLKASVPLRLRRDLIPADNEIAMELGRAMADAASYLNIELPSVAIYLRADYADHRITAHERRKIQSIVIPPYFPALLRSKPGQANAILAHELAHLQQGDCRFWTLSNVYHDFVIRLIVPGAIVSLVSTLLLWHQSEVQVLRDQVLIAIATSVVTIVSMFVFFSILRKLRRDSELMADLAAVLSGYGDGLMAALNRSDNEKKLHISILSKHPSLKKRKRTVARWIAEYSKYTTGSLMQSQSPRFWRGAKGRVLISATKILFTVFLFFVVWIGAIVLYVEIFH